MAARSFEFKQCLTLLKATGMKAQNLSELRKVIAAVSDDSLYHHIYQYFLKDQILQYTNDFAHWAGESLEESALAEHLSNIDPYAFATVADLRGDILRVIDEYLVAFPEPREALPGDAFYFNETVTVTFPAGVRAQNLAEFLIGIKYVDPSSIYYHFYEARTRLGGASDDFSVWIEEVLGKAVLASAIRTIDPFMHTIEKIREHIVEVVEDAVRSDMEEIGS